MDSEELEEFLLKKKTTKENLHKKMLIKLKSYLKSWASNDGLS